MEHIEIAADNYWKHCGVSYKEKMVKDAFRAGVEWQRQQAAAAESQALRDIARMRVVEDMRNREQGREHRSVET